MPGAAGGGVVQDWTTLMMLISQTVDPDACEISVVRATVP